MKELDHKEIKYNRNDPDDNSNQTSDRLLISREAEVDEIELYYVVGGMGISNIISPRDPASGLPTGKARETGSGMATG